MEEVEWKKLGIYQILHILSFFGVEFNTTPRNVDKWNMKIGSFFITEDNVDKYITQNPPLLYKAKKNYRKHLLCKNPEGIQKEREFKLDDVIDLYGKWGSKYFKKVYFLYNTIKVIMVRTTYHLNEQCYLKKDMLLFDKFMHKARNLTFEYYIVIFNQIQLEEQLKRELLRKKFKQIDMGTNNHVIIFEYVKKKLIKNEKVARNYNKWKK